MYLVRVLGTSHVATLDDRSRRRPALEVKTIGTAFLTPVRDIVLSSTLSAGLHILVGLHSTLPQPDGNMTT